MKIETEDMNHIQVPATLFMWRTSKRQNRRTLYFQQDSLFNQSIVHYHIH